MHVENIGGNKVCMGSIHKPLTFLTFGSFSSFKDYDHYFKPVLEVHQ